LKSEQSPIAIAVQHCIYITSLRKDHKSCNWQRHITSAYCPTMLNEFYFTKHKSKTVPVLNYHATEVYGGVEK